MDVVVKRKPKKSTPKKGQKVNNDEKFRTARWVIGITLLAFGVYLLVTVASHLFNWKSELTGDGSSGDIGAWFSSLLVGNSFGAFGVLVPIMVVIFAFKVLLKRLKWYDHTLISFALVTILGSLTLGAAFDTDFDMFNSGWGGTFGIEISRIIKGKLGNPGMVILILLAWILTAVFINIRVIELVNSLGSGIANKGKGLVDKVTRRREDDDTQDDTQDEPEAEPAVEDVEPEDDEPEVEPEDDEPEPEPEVEPDPIVEPEPEPIVEPEPEVEPEISDDT